LNEAPKKGVQSHFFFVIIKVVVVVQLGEVMCAL